MVISEECEIVKWIVKFKIFCLHLALGKSMSSSIFPHYGLNRRVNWSFQAYEEKYSEFKIMEEIILLSFPKC